MPSWHHRKSQMKRIVFAVLIVLVSSGNAQVSQVLPSGAKPGDTLTITYDPSVVGANLSSATSLVLHWGINELGAQNSGNWQKPPQSIWPAGSVAFGDGKAAESPMVKGSDGKWIVRIAALDTIRSVHYVFHSGTPGTQSQSSWTWSNSGNWNFYLVKPVDLGTRQVEFVFDPRSSSVSYAGTIDTVYLAGSFNSWANNSSGVVTNAAFAMKRYSDGTFRRTESLPIGGPVQYKYVIKPNSWYTDPDNPNVDPSSGNSVVDVDSSGPAFVDFLPASGTVFRNDTSSFVVLAQILRGSKHGIDAATLEVTMDGIPVTASIDGAGKISAIISSPTRGRHDMVFSVSDSAGASVKSVYAFGVSPASGVYLAVDPEGDDDGPGSYAYPQGYVRGSADISEFRISPTANEDSLSFVMKFSDVTIGTAASIIISSSPAGSMVQDPVVSDLLEPDWQSRGVYVALCPGLGPGKFQAVYSGRNPLNKMLDVALNADAETSDSISFRIALSDLEAVLGSFTGKWYISAFSYLVDNSGNVVKVREASGGSDNVGNPSVFDVLYLAPNGQERLLSNYLAPSSGSPLFAKLDNDGRGFAAVSAADVGLDYSGLPNVVLLTQPVTTHKGAWTVAGDIIGQDGKIDSSISSVTFYIAQGGNTTVMNGVAVSGGFFSEYVMLSPGDNKIQVKAANSLGKSSYSAALHISYIVDKSPYAAIRFKDNGASILVYGDSSRSRVGGPLAYQWTIDTVLSASRLAVAGSWTSAQIGVTRPKVSGEYYFTLTVTDSANDTDIARSYFSYTRTGDSISLPTQVPAFVKSGRVYQIFVRSFTSEGTIAAAAKQLKYIHDLGYNIIWLMPVMQNQNPIDGMGGGYNITDFYKIAPEYGTMSDFRDFVGKAHALGIRVVLDITPNHVSPSHEWVKSAMRFRQYSPCWNYLQHSYGDYSNAPDGMDEHMSADGSYFHFSDWALANLDWNDIDLRYAMLDVLKYWLNEGVDGFRLDVYWGPHLRSGDANFDRPLRDAVKHRKLDSFVLAEATGTGPGTEQYYADRGGGADASYDRKLWQTMTNGGAQNGTKPFSAGFVNMMDFQVSNSGYYPGPNSFFLRYLENQDESRLAYDYDNVGQTMPLATVLMTVPGIPTIYAGQEVGFGSGMDQFGGRRNTVDFGTRYAKLLIPHYERLAWIRGTLKAFFSQKDVRLSTGNDMIYAFARPSTDQNAIVVSNFGASTATANISIVASGSSANVDIPGAVDSKTHYMNDVYNDKSVPIVFSGGQATFSATLPGYGTAVYILADSVIHIDFPVITSAVSDHAGRVPEKFELEQNYPNPFNPATRIGFRISNFGFVSLKVYDVLGREVRTLVNEVKKPGSYEVRFDAGGLSSGVYFYRIQAGSYSAIKKMMLIR